MLKILGKPPTLIELKSMCGILFIEKFETLLATCVIFPNSPVSVETSVALLARDPWFAAALPGLEVALGVLRGLAAPALQTPGLAVEAEAPVVGLALVTPGPHHPGETLALAIMVVTLPGPLSVTRARLTVLGLVWERIVRLDKVPNTEYIQF